MNLNYTTTAEFGDIDYIKFFVGTMTGEEMIELTPSYITGDHLESFNLLNLIDSTLGQSSPVGEYLYVRAEMQTFVDYTGSENIYRTTYDQFHSFTNPIWINWDVYAGVEQADLSFKIYPNPTAGSFNIEFNDASNFEMVSVYNNLGQKIIEQKNIFSKMTIDLSNLSSGMYWVSLLGKDGHVINKKVVKR